MIKYAKKEVMGWLVRLISVKIYKSADVYSSLTG
jgi:hypothetical protein